MQILLAVIDDLFQFARTAIFGVLSESKFQQRSQNILFSAYPTSQLQLPSFEKKFVDDATTHAHDANEVFSSGASYFVGEARAFLYSEPVVAFDTASMQLPYGAVAHVQKLGGRWAEVIVDGVQGWVFKDILREQISDVLPSFVEGEFYDAQNPQTIKLRTFIEDSFGAHFAALPLTDAEFVTYKLEKRGVHIPWTLERPRTAGTWQRKLRGRVGIHMSITPYVGTIMEYISDDQGHLCFVEAVFPDDSIKITSVGIFAEGTYTEALMTKDEWKELRPVFIEVT